MILRLRSKSLVGRLLIDLLSQIITKLMKTKLHGKLKSTETEVCMCKYFVMIIKSLIIRHRNLKRQIEYEGKEFRDWCMYIQYLACSSLKSYGTCSLAGSSEILN